MVDVQFAWLFLIPAVLAGEVIASQNVFPREFHLPFWQSIVERQNNDRRNINTLARGADGFQAVPTMNNIGTPRRRTQPALKVISPVNPRVVSVNNLSMSKIEKGEGATCRADMNRLPISV